MADGAGDMVPRRRLLLVASGDFAFNLYWQSAMLFLLFHTTDALGVQVATAAALYAAASVWDGLVSLAVGLWVDRGRGARRYGAILVGGAIPLGLAFTLAYAPPPTPGAWGLAVPFAGHLAFRTAYAALNLPYLALCARVSPDAGDRAWVAGARMLFGTAAAVVVALGTVPAGRWLTGGGSRAEIHWAAAGLFAVAATALLAVVGATFREADDGAERRRPPTLRAAIASLARNRAFVTLSLAMVAMIVAATLLNKGVLYYAKYVVGDEGAGQLALAGMGVVAAVAIPAWVFLGRRLGLRTVWLLAVAGAGLGLAGFGALGVDGAGGMQAFLLGVQAMTVGLHFAFWALLPAVIDYGERETGLHVEGAVFGVAALLGRVAIGLGTLVLGWSFDAAGFVPNAAPDPATLDGIRVTVAAAPLLFLALSAAAILACPLGARPRAAA